MSRIIRPSVETALAQVRRLYHPDSAEGVLVDAVDEVDRLMRTVFDAVREGMS
jgi:hypothetical protein